VAGASGGGGQNDQAGAPLAAGAATPGTCRHYFAVVNADGTLARGGCGVAAVGRGDVGGGSYVVRWTRNALRCATVATIGISGSSGVAASGFVDTAGRYGDPQATYVVTRDTSGHQTDRPFHVALVC
jgi:hypothetical protein